MNIIKEIIASAPAKIIIFGEHFVVYDKPAILGSIGLRINALVRVTKEKNNAIISINSNQFGKRVYPISIIRSENTKNQENDIFYPIIYIVKKILHDRNWCNGLDINIRSDIPVGVGLGSSAASCVAVTASVMGLLGEINKKKILDISIEAERLIHKNTSGADCIISTYGGLVHYEKNSGFINIEMKKKLSFIIVNTRIRHSTGELVATVKRFRDNNLIEFNRLGELMSEIIKNARNPLETGDIVKIGQLMNENQAILEKLGVSNLDIKKIIELCKMYGAVGSKLTGAGGGGCVLALVDSYDKLDFLYKLKRAGYECFSVSIENFGVYVNT